MNTTYFVDNDVLRVLVKYADTALIIHNIDIDNRYSSEHVHIQVVIWYGIYRMIYLSTVYTRYLLTKYGLSFGSSTCTISSGVMLSY